MEPRFSIIVPIYNVEQYLVECLDSLLCQSFSDFEVILIDDVSRDQSAKIAQDYARKNPQCMTFIQHETNKGLGGARNTGIQAAKGEFLLFLDSDDYLRPDALEKLDGVLTQTGAQLAEFCFRRVDENGRYLNRDYGNGDCTLPALVKHSVNACNKAFHRELFANVRFPEKCYYEDYYTVPKLLLCAKSTALLNEDLYCYRQRIGSIVHDTNVQKNRDILTGTDSLLAFAARQDFGSDALRQLEYLAVVHVLYHATLRVNSIAPGDPLQKELKNYVEKHFPDYENNPYRKLLTARQKALLKRIEKEQYGLLHLQYHCRNRITGWIRRMVWKWKGM